MEISILNVLAVILSASFAIYSAKIVEKVAFLVKKLAKPAENPKTKELRRKIAETRQELQKISPTGEFAKYFKKDRELNKLSEELEKIEAEGASETARNLKIDTIVRIFLQFSNLALLRYVSSITAYCIPETIFWPFNLIIRFPAVFGNESCPKEFSEVSGFALAFLMIHLLNLLVKNFKKIKN